MESNQKILKIISNETINAVTNMDIVTPSMYKSFFSKHASSHNTELKDEEKITDSLLDSKILSCQNVQEKNSNNVIQLSDNTSRAISAIQNKDESSLKEVLRETEALKHEIEKLKEAVYTDELTHVFNRKWMNDNFLIVGGDELKSNGTLVMIDLNYFKIINDTFGHIIGDKVLVFLANQLKKTRANVIRYGGDEFIIIFSNLDSDTSVKKVNAIRETIITKKLKAGEAHFRVSFSIGAYEFEKGDDLSNVIELADKNMYNDKIKIKQRITGIE